LSWWEGEKKKMKVRVDIPNDYFEANKKKAMERWNDDESEDQFIDKGMKFEFDISLDNIEQNGKEISMYGSQASPTRS
jgi:hypothetical protein